MSGARADALVKRWCPGSLRPMESGDGLIARIRITGGIVAVALARQIARWSLLWGNGQIDLSNRANLQLRGLSARHLPYLQDALAEWGLLDGTEAAEAVRNVTSSPLAGLDPAAVLDVRPIVSRLEQRLADDPSLHRLPGKFGFAIDDGGSLPLDDVPADIRFVAHRTEDGPAFAVHLAGARHVPFGPCHPGGLADVAEALSHMFLGHRIGREAVIRRMRDVVAAVGLDAVGREAELRAIPALSPRPPLRPSAILGAHPLGAAAYVGAGLPFGRIAAEDFAALASVAAANGPESLRLTPFRAILVPVPSVVAARVVLDGLTTASFILDPDHPLLRLAACSGAPSCPRATTLVREDATTLAAAAGGAAGQGIAIHVSGCAKGCAHPWPAPFTLVGRDGRYDLVLDGAPSTSPVRHNLTLDQAADHLSRIVTHRPEYGAA